MGAEWRRWAVRKSAQETEHKSRTVHLLPMAYLTRRHAAHMIVEDTPEKKHRHRCGIARCEAGHVHDGNVQSFGVATIMLNNHAVEIREKPWGRGARCTQ
jgi:hypothetical protein